MSAANLPGPSPLELFGRGPASPPPALVRPAAMADPETSWAAGREDTPGKREHRSRLRAQILRLHQAAADGLTDDELATQLLDEDRGTIAKRRGDLVRDGELVDTGRTRRTRRGCAAIVWAVVG